MNAVGSWKVTLATPMGPQDMILHIDSQNKTFKGRIDSPMGAMDVDGEVDGAKLHWVMAVEKPMSITVTFDVTVDGDRMSGSAKMGMMGKANVTGNRLAPGEAAPSEAKEIMPEILTEDFVDPKFNEPYIDIDEQRTDPVPHRYVHGAFKGTDARFSFYFPPAEQYEKRFFHNTYPMAVTEDVGPFPIQFDVAVGDIGFTLDSGAYYVQTNLGGADRAPPADPAIGAYRVNAAAAKFSRKVAADIYGPHRPYGYIFGGSGGSYQVMGAAEHTQGIWDGFVPYVLGCNNAIPSMFTIRMHAMRVLREGRKFAGIMDAINPGGSGDPYAGLNEVEAAALREATLMGYPPRGWYNHETLTSGYFSNVAAIVPMLDPTYVEDFWSKPGYLGTDPASSIRDARFTFDTEVARVIEGHANPVEGPPKLLELKSVPDKDFSDSHVVFLSGALQGKSLPLAHIDGQTVAFAFSATRDMLEKIKPGDKVRIDNSWPLALQTYHRHQIAEPELYGWDQYKDADGKPIYPQRAMLIGPVGAAGTAGKLTTGAIKGKTLVVEVMMDIDALPWQADWYRNAVKKQLGARFDDVFAIYFIDHAQHDNPLNPQAHAHSVSFSGALQQALRDLSAWVENGVKPSQTEYKVVDTQIIVSDNAGARRGIQPVIALKANGGERVDIRASESVTFDAVIDVPPGAGKVVSAEWDFEGAGTYPVKAAVETPGETVRLSATHAYSKPGTYFPVLRAASQRKGDAATPYGRVQNLARVRVVVT